MVKSVRVRRKEFQPTLNARVVFADFGEVFQGLVVRIDAEGGASKVVTERFDGPHDSSSLKVKRRPITL